MSGIGEFAYTLLLGWMRTLVDWFWLLFSGGGHSGVLQWFLANWKLWLVILLVGGLVVDWLMWLIRWRPYRLLFRGPRRAETPAGNAQAKEEAWDDGVGYYDPETAPDSEPMEWTDLTLHTLSEIDPNWAGNVDMSSGGAEEASPAAPHGDPQYEEPARAAPAADYYDQQYEEPAQATPAAGYYDQQYEEPVVAAPAGKTEGQGYWMETPDELEMPYGADHPGSQWGQEAGYEPAPNGQWGQEAEYEPAPNGQWGQEAGYEPAPNGQWGQEAGYEPAPNGQWGQEAGYKPAPNGQWGQEAGYEPAPNGQWGQEAGYEPASGEQWGQEAAYGPDPGAAAAQGQPVREGDEPGPEDTLRFGRLTPWPGSFPLAQESQGQEARPEAGAGAAPYGGRAPEAQGAGRLSRRRRRENQPGNEPDAAKRRRRRALPEAEHWDDDEEEMPTAARAPDPFADTRPSRVVRPAAEPSGPPRKGLRTVTGKPARRRGFMRFTSSEEEPISGLPPLDLTDPFLPAAQPGNPDFEPDDGAEARHRRR